MKGNAFIFLVLVDKKKKKVKVYWEKKYIGIVPVNMD